MANTDIFPDAAGNYQQWINGAGSVPGNVQTNDGDTTRRQLASGNTGIDTFTLDDLPTDAEIINTVIARALLKRQGAGSGNFRNYIRENATDAFSGTFTVSTVYVTYSNTFATAPDASAWTPTSVNAMEGGYQRSSSGAAEVRCTQTFVNVDYEQAGSSFITFFSMLSPLIGGALTYAQFAQAMRLITLHHRNRIRWRADEMKAMWEAYRAWGHRAYLFV